MSQFFAFIYDPLIAKTETDCLQDWRKALLANAYRTVLEVGTAHHFYNLSFLHISFLSQKPRKLCLIMMDNK
jgi:hypothetical protein